MDSAGASSRRRTPHNKSQSVTDMVNTEARQLDGNGTSETSAVNNAYRGGSLAAEVELSAGRKRPSEGSSSRSQGKKRRTTDHPSNTDQPVIDYAGDEGREANFFAEVATDSLDHIPTYDQAEDQLSDEENFPLRRDTQFDQIASILNLSNEQRGKVMKLARVLKTQAQKDIAIISLLTSTQPRSGDYSNTWVPPKQIKEYIKSSCRSYLLSPAVKGYGTIAGENIMEYIVKTHDSVIGWPEQFIQNPESTSARRVVRDVIDKELIELRSQLKKEICRGMPKSSHTVAPMDPVPRETIPPVEKVTENIEKLGQRKSDSKQMNIVDSGTESEMLPRVALLRTLASTCISGRRGHYWRWVDEVLTRLDTVPHHMRDAIMVEVVEHDKQTYPKSPPKHFEQDGRSELPTLLHQVVSNNSAQQ